MNRVGDDLANTARGERDEILFDLFGRSAYNRYYYALFLHVRAVLNTIDTKWATPTHKDLPVVLRGDVLKRVKKEIHTAKKSGQIDSGEGKRIYNSVAAAVAELTALLDSAREVRRVADYEPEVGVEKDEDVISLSNCKLDTAKNWKRRGEYQAKTILRVYGELGLI